MSSRSGLGAVEVALLEAVEGLGGTAEAGRRKTVRVLQALEAAVGLGPRYGYPVLIDLSVPWRRHLLLLDVNGNVGSAHGDPPADVRYTELRLTPIGALALAAERGEVGPVPLELVDGSLYRDGPVPPFDPRAVVAALRERTGDAGLPVLPTGGDVGGEVDELMAGRRARLTLSCDIVREPGALVVTAVPLGVRIDDVAQYVEQRSRDLEPRRRLHADYVIPLPTAPPVLPFGVDDVRDESSMRVGVRVVVRLRHGSDPDAAQDWLRSVWPVTTEVDARLPAPQRRRLLDWDAGDGTGLDALAPLLEQ